MRIDKPFIRLPRHPLPRALALIAGTVLLIGLIAMGLLIGATVAAAAGLAVLARRWLNGRGRRQTDPDIIEGEFTVVPPHRAALSSTEQPSATRTGW